MSVAFERFACTTEDDNEPIMNAAELAREVRRLEITTRHQVTEVFAGEYSSAFKGRGIEFADVREYQPGDDVRTIDWNVTARAGRPFIKRFSEERELTVVLAVDCSASGLFASNAAGRTKRRVAAEVAAILGFAGVKKGDRVGLLLFSDRVERWVPPRKGTRHALRLVRDLLAFEPRGKGTDLAAAAERLASVLHRRALVFVVSDFLGTSPKRDLRTITSRHEPIAVEIVDPRERRLVSAGLIEMRDPESGLRVTLDTSSAMVRSAYAREAERLRSRVAGDLRSAGIDHVTISTDSRPGDALARFFMARERRR